MEDAKKISNWSPTTFSVKFYNKPLHSDLTLILKNPDGKTTEYHGHQIILSRSSPVFRAMLNGEWKEKKESSIVINNIFHPDLNAFEQFFRALYNGLDDNETLS